MSLPHRKPASRTVRKNSQGFRGDLRRLTIKRRRLVSRAVMTALDSLQFLFQTGFDLRPFTINDAEQRYVAHAFVS